MIKILGANVNPKSNQKVGKSIGVVQHSRCKIFEWQTSHFNISDSHPYPSFGKDFNSILNVLEEENVFVTGCKRKQVFWSERSKYGTNRTCYYNSNILFYSFHMNIL